MGKTLARVVAITVIVAIVLLICVILMARLHSWGPGVLGGARRKPDPALSPHIVVDTLNLVHWQLPRGGALTPETIIEVIDRTAPVLKLRHPGRVMYVVKDRETTLNDDAARELYAGAANRNGIYVYVVERYSDPPAGTAPTPEHSSRGRDDMFVAMLAYRWKCAVLTEDRLRDFDRFRATVPPFHVYEYAFWRELPYREFVRPDAAAYARIKKPKRVGFVEYFG